MKKGPARGKRSFYRVLELYLRAYKGGAPPLYAVWMLMIRFFFVNTFNKVKEGLIKSPAKRRINRPAYS